MNATNYGVTPTLQYLRNFRYFILLVTNLTLYWSK